MNYRLTLQIDPYPRVLSAKVFNVKGRMVAKVHPTSQTVKYQKDLEKLISIAWKQPPLKGPLRVFVMFFLRRPKSISKLERPFPILPPDVDNLQKALFDPMTKCRVWEDDSQIIQVTAQKRYADDCEPKIEIVLERVMDGFL